LEKSPIVDQNTQDLPCYGHIWPHVAAQIEEPNQRALIKLRYIKFVATYQIQRHTLGDQTRGKPKRVRLVSAAGQYRDSEGPGQKK
jgi:hypothetical protein